MRNKPTMGTKTDIAILKTKLEVMHVDMKDHKKQSIQQNKEIIALLKITNGRVGKLEQFKAWVKGGLALAVVFVPVGIGVGMYIFQRIVN